MLVDLFLLLLDPERPDLTTQGATEVLRMDHNNYATSAVNLSAAAGCLLEYLPDPIIPERWLALRLPRACNYGR